MDKERKIAFYTLVKDMWANNADGLEGLIPFYEIKEVFKVGSINSIFYFLHKAAEPFNCLEQDNLA